MPSPFELSPKERADYGFARVRDAAFDAVTALWRKRQQEGMNQLDLAAAIGKDAAWVSRKLRGPGNWTLKTFGAFIEGLHGEANITVRAAEDHPARRFNHHAYADYEIQTNSSGLPVQACGAMTRKGSASRPDQIVITSVST